MYDRILTEDLTWADSKRLKIDYVNHVEDPEDAKVSRYTNREGDLLFPHMSLKDYLTDAVNLLKAESGNTFEDDCFAYTLWDEGWNDYRVCKYRKYNGGPEYECLIYQYNSPNIDGICSYYLMPGLNKIKNKYQKSLDKGQVEVEIEEQLEESSRRQKAQQLFNNPEKRKNVKTFCIMSVDNPMGNRVSNKDNKDIENSFEQKMGSMFTYFKVKGRYGINETSYIIYNISLNDASIFARNYSQESFIFVNNTEEGLQFNLYVTNDANTVYRNVETQYLFTNESDAEDDFTKISRNFKFNIPFEFFDKTFNESVDFYSKRYHHTLNNMTNENYFTNRFHFGDRRKTMMNVLNEAMEVHDILNPKLFSGDVLRDDVRDKLLEIVDEAVNYCDLEIVPLDCHLVGSSASYNYHKDSDIDLHIIVNFDSIDGSEEVVQAWLNSVKTSFNKTYDITIKDIPVELYFEDVKSGAVSNGVYSLFKNEWIKHPVPIDVPILDTSDEVHEWEERIEIALSNKDKQEITDVINDLYIMRKESIIKDGEYGFGNQVFKDIRNEGLLTELKDSLVEIRSDELTLESWELGTFQE